MTNKQHTREKDNNTNNTNNNTITETRRIIITQIKQATKHNQSDIPETNQTTNKQQQHDTTTTSIIITKSSNNKTQLQHIAEQHNRIKTRKTTTHTDNI